MKIDLLLVKRLNNYRTYFSIAMVLSIVASIVSEVIYLEKSTLLSLILYLMFCIVLWDLFIVLNWCQSAKSLLNQMFITSNNMRKKRINEFDAFVESMMSYREQVYKIRLLMFSLVLFIFLINLFVAIEIPISLQILGAVVTGANVVSILSFLIKSDNDFDTMILKYGDNETRKIVNSL